MKSNELGMKGRQIHLDTIGGILICYMMLMHILLWRLIPLTNDSIWLEPLKFFMFWFFFKSGEFFRLKETRAKLIGGERPRTSAYNSEILQSESLAEVSCPISSIIDPFLGRPNSHISNDAYKLKVEKFKFRVLGRAGGGRHRFNPLKIHYHLFYS